MEHICDDFELIYQKVTGNLQKDISLPWVENAFVEGSEFKRAYDTFWKVRESLCRRFDLEWEDEDLERFMNGVIALERDLAQRMFYYGMAYSRRHYQI